MKATWTTRVRAKTESSLMPLLFALCALLAVAPSQAARALPLSPSHFAAFALLSSELSGDESAPAQITPAHTQRAALLLALCRHAATPLQAATPSVFSVALSHFTLEKHVLPSQATSHLAGRTTLLSVPFKPQCVAFARAQTLTAHEVAQLSGVRTNIRLI